MKPDQAENLRLLEALLFASSEPMQIDAIEKRLQSASDKSDSQNDVRSLLHELKRQYEDRGINLIEVGGAWAFRTAPDLSDRLTMTEHAVRKLSRAAMETLSIIAYHQPVTRAEIENIRGVVTNKGTLDALVEAGWVKPGRRRQVPGKPLTWVTTNGFLDHFGLEALTDLPGIDELKSAGLLDRRPAVQTLPGVNDLFEGIDEDAETGDDNTGSDLI